MSEILEIGAGVHPDSPRALVRWNPANTGSTETPIKINQSGVIGELPAHTMAIVPDFVAEMLVNSSFDVEVLEREREPEAQPDGEQIVDPKKK